MSLAKRINLSTTAQTLALKLARVVRTMIELWMHDDRLRHRLARHVDNLVAQMSIGQLVVLFVVDPATIHSVAVHQRTNTIGSPMPVSTRAGWT